MFSTIFKYECESRVRAVPLNAFYIPMKMLNVWISAVGHLHPHNGRCGNTQQYNIMYVGLTSPGLVHKQIIKLRIIQHTNAGGTINESKKWERDLNILLL